MARKPKTVDVGVSYDTASSDEISPFVQMTLEGVLRNPIYRSLSYAERSALAYLGAIMSSGNRIDMSASRKQEMSEYFDNMTIKQVNLMLRSLVKKSALAKIGPGSFMVNPELMVKGKQNKYRIKSFYDILNGKPAKSVIHLKVIDNKSRL